ncbi:TerC/Alx family metal homeostasis membrane protein [Vibrio olivae]|uniref:TerC/Alx family metal homeostasis membrane protein n=1 Tax=Vibrio olivae TaxID=1243002 RepID=A0ABV5HRI3_9VIBR
MPATTYFAFFLGTVLMVCLDIWQTRGGVISVKKAALWSVFWVVLAALFAASIYQFWDFYAPYSPYTPHQAAMAFTTGYLLEKSLSIDNLFVFAIIFSQYSVPTNVRPRALLYGVIGALVLRMMMIVLGAELLNRYHWTLYLFAAFLIWTGISLFREQDQQEEVNPLPEKLIRRWLPMTRDFHQHHLTMRLNDGKRMATPLVVVIAVIAFMDVLFALDSIPAIFAVTREPFLVLAANVFALLGLRSLYFVLEGLISRFVYLKPALAVIMLFIGVKMLLSTTAWAIETQWSLGFIACIMMLAVIASILKERKSSDVEHKENQTNQV